MDIQFFLRSVTVVALASFFFLTSACSKNETASEASTPSPSATAAVSPTVTPVPAGSPFADVQLRMRDLESKLDNIFSESYRDFGTLFGPTVFGSSVDLREQKDKYVARVYPPNGDTSKVNARIDSGVLRITIEGTQTTSGTTTSENDEQVITLPEPVLADQMQIERKQNLVLITIPKSKAAVAAASPAPTPVAAASASSPGATADWDERMFTGMNRMQTRMDQIFRDAFPNDLLNSANMLRLGSTVNVEDQKDKYVVHFTLPERDLNNVNVKFENGRVHLTAEEQKKSSNSAPGTLESVERGHYEEMIALPGPVKDSDMKVDRKGSSSIDVTLPKAS